MAENSAYPKYSGYAPSGNSLGIVDAQWGVRVPDEYGLPVDMVTRMPVGTVNRYAMPPRTDAYNGTWQAPAWTQALLAKLQGQTYDTPLGRWDLPEPSMGNTGNNRGRYTAAQYAGLYGPSATQTQQQASGLLNQTPTVGAQQPTFSGTGLLGSGAATNAAATAPTLPGNPASNSIVGFGAEQTPTGSMSALSAFTNPTSGWQKNYNDLYAQDPRLAMNYLAKADTGNEFRRLLDSQYGNSGAQAFNYWYSPNNSTGQGGAYSRAALNGNTFVYVAPDGTRKSVTLKY